MSDGATDSPKMARNRWIYGGLTILTIGLGLASRRFVRVLPVFLKKNAGDALWALMVFYLIGLLFPKRSTGWVASVALAFSVLIELSQLYHAPWIDMLRSYTLGHLVLGSGFGWSDMVCYAVGILIGAVIERATIAQLSG